MALAIGEVARRAGCSVPTIRYYEEVGLVAPAARSDKGRRIYGFPDVARLRFIRRARDFGMSIEQVRDLTNAETLSGAACEPARSVIAARLEEVVTKRDELEKLRVSLEAMLARCNSQCDTRTACCTIFEDIDHAPEDRASRR